MGTTERVRERAARYQQHRAVSGTVTVEMLLELPPSVSRDRLIERLVRAAEGTPEWVLDAWAGAEDVRRAAERDRLARRMSG